MTYEIKTYKDYDGKWRAESTAPIGETEEGIRTLELNTAKAGGGITSYARVHILQPDGTKVTILCGDFTKYNIVSAPCKRVTEKSIRQLHQLALLKMNDLIQEAREFYANSENEET